MENPERAGAIERFRPERQAQADVVRSMKTIALLPLALAAASCATTTPRALTAEEQSALAEAIRGRTAEAPVSCVSQTLLRGNRSVGEGAILFEGSNGRLYVNMPPAGCPSLRADRTLITRTPTGQLCRGDIVRVADLTSGIDYGSCSLGDFTPYGRRAD